MDSFEQVVAALLVRRGYWVQTSLKVELTKEDKRKIGRDSSPRWELDVVGYCGAKNEILVMECKSFLDSVGVRHKHLLSPQKPNRYKLFTEPILRETVLGRLTLQLASAGFCATNPTVRLGMAAGKVHKADHQALDDLFTSQGWELWTPMKLRSELTALADSGYENTVAAIVTKLLLRNP